MTKKVYIHESAYVEKGAEIGEGTKIWHFSHIMGDARIGKGCKIGQNVFIGGNVKIGDNVKIQNNVSVYEGVTLEDNVFCGPSVVFTNIINPRSKYPQNTSDKYKNTLVREGATIGANTTVVCGYVIGVDAFIGAGAVVTKDIPDYALVYGNPARIKGWVCGCGNKLSFNIEEATCLRCNSNFKRIDGHIVVRDL
jgi:UDP-2-acetamido-3-amino-2,3-dideoxy-glucuronate N-acetyltransferase